MYVDLTQGLNAGIPQFTSAPGTRARIVWVRDNRVINDFALMPPMLQHLFGYDVIDTGLVLAPRGIGVLVRRAEVERDRIVVGIARLAAVELHLQRRGAAPGPGKVGVTARAVPASSLLWGAPGGHRSDISGIVRAPPARSRVS